MIKKMIKPIIKIIVGLIYFISIGYCLFMVDKWLAIAYSIYAVGSFGVQFLLMYEKSEKNKELSKHLKRINNDITNNKNSSSPSNFQ